MVPGIDLPERPAADVRAAIRKAGETLVGEQRVIAFGCAGEKSVRQLRKAGAAVVEVACMGQLPPAFIDFVLSRNHADGVFLLGCEDGNCNYRYGAEWTDQRLARERDPRLRQRVSADKIASAWQTPWSDSKNVLAAYRRFVDEL